VNSASPPPAIHLESIAVAYGRRLVLENVSFTVRQGRFAALIGPNGAGKSTCLRAVLGLVKPRSGRVEVFGAPPGGRDLRIGYVPQRIDVPRGFPITALDVALMGRTGVLGPGRRPGPSDRKAARSALEQVGLLDQTERRFQDLSGGQQQRVLIARALCGDPRLLLLDEPTAGLDSGARARFYALVCDLQHARGLTLLCATHDLDVVGDHADELILLDTTVRARGSPREVLAGQALGRAYTFPIAHVHEPEPPGPA
jgi:ABC-type Mn2+/Zn2+ transport system ATPase subunit